MSDPITPHSTVGVSKQSIARNLWLAICEASVGRRRRATESLSAGALASLSARGQDKDHAHVRHSAQEQPHAGFE